VAATLGYVAIFPSLIAYFCWDRGVARAGATVPVYFANLTPLFAALIATLWLGEEIALFHLLGGVLIFLGIIVGNRR
jgi:drug/metabolite transporter (DMT)-like permease